jgi:AmmeMemoRadiSam system protein A
MENHQEMTVSSEELQKFPLDSVLKKNLGLFVTLKINQQLRGCIGLIEAETPLYQNVIDYAVKAAFEDPRFDQLTPSELPQIHLEISVMGPVERVSNVEEIEVGVHGLIMRRGYRQGLLLPQVPIEWGWNRQQFLEHTCQKAGLPPGAYRDPQTEIFFFTATVFGED